MIKHKSRMTVAGRIKSDNERYFRAKGAGEVAALHGLTVDHCPFPSTPSFRVAREGWIAGFQEAGGRLIS
ncbi:MAG: hypothetical protein AAF221_08320 [Pseudomonadota bacterium]